MIETLPHSPRPALQQSGLSFAPDPQTQFVIFKSIHVDADAHRISRALTEPEYLEAWISIPGAAPGSFTRASLEDNGYRLDYYSAHNFARRWALSIEGSFRFCHLRKMRLFWRKTSNALCVESVVDFRLRGNFGSSIVELRHTALASAEEYAWHEALWGSSLQKLALLFGS
ncbi:MAG: hypothetical protein WAL45_13350 [Terracidiphilus sp.]